jgi:hypothetical protein
MTHLGETFTPNPKEHRIYDQLYRQVYLKMYDRLKPLYNKMRGIK